MINSGQTMKNEYLVSELTLLIIGKVTNSPKHCKTLVHHWNTLVSKQQVAFISYFFPFLFCILHHQFRPTILMIPHSFLNTAFNNTRIIMKCLPTSIITIWCDVSFQKYSQQDQREALRNFRGVACRYIGSPAPPGCHIWAVTKLECLLHCFLKVMLEYLFCNIKCIQCSEQQSKSLNFITCYLGIG
jgi:hypothetical protein